MRPVLTGERVERRLTAILAADVAGYSRLMGLDEEGTHAQLKDHRRTLIDPKISEHRGRIIKTTGDGMLVEFASIVDAVRCAVEVQREMAEQNAEVPPAKRIQFRIGINVGDIIVEAEDIYGDGVNVAARLENLSEPGGICVSQVVRDQVGNKLGIEFRDAGEQHLKNIAQPIRTFHIILNGQKPELFPNSPARGFRRAALTIFAAIIALVAVGGGTSWWLYRDRGAAVEPPPIRERPVVAVLPFLTLNAEPADDYFGDGLTEDIISALGRFSELAVLARNAVFPYKGKRLGSEELGRKLGARYLVEGSVRHDPDRLRISIQLANATSGSLLWSTQYDAPPKNIFSIQDDITRQVTGALAVKLTKLEQARAATKPPNQLEAYDLVLRGRAMMSRNTRSANVEARRLFQRAIDLDPSYAAAYVALGDSYHSSFLLGWTDQPVETLQRMQNLATTAIGLDSFSAGARTLLGVVYMQFRQHERAIDELKRAIDLNPSDAETYAWLGSALLYTGRLEDSIKVTETALRFDPNLNVRELWSLGMAYLLAGRTNDAIRITERGISQDTGFVFNYVTLAGAYADAGRVEDAARAVDAVRNLNPFFDTDNYGSLFRNADHRAQITASLRKAGL
jgi:adenylate cyclase